MKSVAKFSKGVKLVALMIFALVLFSCDIRVQESYFTEKLDAIDALILQGEYSQATKKVHALEKKALSPYHAIALSKRYIRMNEFEKSANFMEKALKHNAQDLRLNSIYVWSLLKSNQIEKAYECSKILENTEFAGLFAEASLKKTQLDLQNEIALTSEKSETSVLENTQDLTAQKKLMFLRKDLQNEYLIAYQVCNQVKFLQDAAVYECLRGNFEKAFSYHPIQLPKDEDAEFWMLVSYDSKNYVQTIQDAQFITEKNPELKAKAFMLCADSYLCLHEVELAQKMWEKAFEFDSQSDPNLLVNYSLSCIERGDLEKAFGYAKKAVNLFSNYVPALSLYAKFAINDSVTPEESSLARELRRRGLRSLDMEKQDSRERVQISDAVYRIEKSFEQTGDPILQIELLKLKWASAQNLSKEQIVIDIWNLLENFYSSEKDPDPRILDFAIQTFIEQEKFSEASQLLKQRMYAEFSDTDCMNHLEDLTYSECRLFAAIKNHEKKHSDCQTLLLYASKKSERPNDDVFINLADYAQTNGDYKTATEYYSNVIGRTLNLYTKAELYYRLAQISVQNGDLKNANSYLDYCTQLNPTHSNARLLQKKIRQ